MTLNKPKKEFSISFCAKPNTVEEETSGVPIHHSYMDKEMIPCPQKVETHTHYCGNRIAYFYLFIWVFQKTNVSIVRESTFKGCGKGQQPHWWAGPQLILTASLSDVSRSFIHYSSFGWGAISPTRLPSEIPHWPVSVSALFRLKSIPRGKIHYIYILHIFLEVSIQNKLGIFLLSWEQTCIISKKEAWV